MKIIKEYTNQQGDIIRIAVDKGRLRYSICGYKYINKVLTDDDINRTYISYKEHSEKKGKKGKSVMLYDRFKQYLIDSWALAGVPYRDYKKIESEKAEGE